MFWDLFQKLGLTEKDLIVHKGNLIGFTGDAISLKDYVIMKVTFLGRGGSHSVEVKFLVVDCPSASKADFECISSSSFNLAYGNEVPE